MQITQPNLPHDSDQTVRLDDQLCFALYAATNAITRAYRPLLGYIGLTYPQYLVIMAIWEHGPQTIGQLATKLHLPPGAISPIVDQLEKSEFAQRERDSHDRRVVRVKATQKGSDLEKSAALIQRNIVCQTNLDNQNFVEIRDKLHALIDQLSTHPGIEPASLLGSHLASVSTDID